MQVEKAEQCKARREGINPQTCKHTRTMSQGDAWVAWAVTLLPSRLRFGRGVEGTRRGERGEGGGGKGALSRRFFFESFRELLESGSFHAPTNSKMHHSPQTPQQKLMNPAHTLANSTSLLTSAGAGGNMLDPKERNVHPFLFQASIRTVHQLVLNPSSHNQKTTMVHQQASCTVRTGLGRPLGLCSSSKAHWNNELWTPNTPNRSSSSHFSLSTAWLHHRTP